MYFSTLKNVYFHIFIYEFVFFFSDRQGLRNADEVRRLNQAVLAALHRELTNNPPHVPTKGDVSILHLLTNKRLALRFVSLTLHFTRLKTNRKYLTSRLKSCIKRRPIFRLRFYLF